jgi:hypothetical protein
MTHQYGTLEEVNSPFFGPGTFEPPWPKRVDALGTPGVDGRGKPCEVQEYGEHFYSPERSAVTKENGRNASLNGPAPDMAEAIARPIPVGTKRRFGPPRTDK